MIAFWAVHKPQTGVGKTDRCVSSVPSVFRFRLSAITHVLQAFCNHCKPGVLRRARVMPCWYEHAMGWLLVLQGCHCVDCAIPCLVLDLSIDCC